MYHNYYTSVKDFRANWKNYNSKEIRNLCKRQKLSNKFIREMKDHLDWFTISQYQPLTEEQMVEFKELINWEYLCRYNRKIKLSEQFMEKMIDYINWDSVAKSRHLTLDFVKKHADKLNPNYIFSNYAIQDLHNGEVLDILLKVNGGDAYQWYNSVYRDITFDFVREWKDHIKFSRVMHAFNNDHKLEEFVEEFEKYFTKEDWGSLEGMLYNTSFDFVIKYSEHWNYRNYSNPTHYSSCQYTAEQRDYLNKLWELHQNDKY